MRRFSLLLIALALPVATYVVGVVLVPSYIQSFIVKPNEIDRESPYIGYNIEWTRRGFGLDQIELREFEAENSIAALDLPNNRESLENIRLWDWRALQDTLRQIQAIRTYYDFPDVDVDRYLIGGNTRQMMIAPREINDAKLSFIVAQLDQRTTDLHARIRRDDEQRERLHSRRSAAVCLVEHAG